MTDILRTHSVALVRVLDTDNMPISRPPAEDSLPSKRRNKSQGDTCESLVDALGRNCRGSSKSFNLERERERERGKLEHARALGSFEDANLPAGNAEAAE